MLPTEFPTRRTLQRQIRLVVVGHKRLLSRKRLTYNFPDCLADDIVYQMPVRKTVYRRNGDGFDGRNSHWDDNRQSLGMRVKRSVDLASAFDRDPPPHIRRMVTNLIVRKTDTPGEYAAMSYMLLLRNRFDAPTYDILSAKREDLIRRSSDGTCKLARRLILLDQTALGAVFINVFM